MNNPRQILVIMIMCFGIQLCFYESQVESQSPQFSWSRLITEDTFGLNWSLDGEYIIFGDLEANEIVSIDAVTGVRLWQVPLPEGGHISILDSMELSPDGQSVALTSLDNNSIYVFHIVTGEWLQIRDRSSIPLPTIYRSVQWSADSSRVAVITNYGDVQVFSSDTGDLVQSVDIAMIDSLRGESGVFDYKLFAWTPDSTLFAAPYYAINQSTQSISGTVAIGIWDQQGRLIGTSDYPNSEQPVDDTACVHYARQYINEILDLEWAPDSRTLAVTGSDGYGTCILGNQDFVQQRQIFTHQPYTMPGSPAILRWSPDQRWLVGASEYRESPCAIRLSDAANNYATRVEEIDSEECWISSLVWHPNSQSLAVGTRNGLWIGRMLNN